MNCHHSSDSCVLSKERNQCECSDERGLGLIDKKIDESRRPEADQSFVSCFVEEEKREPKFDQLQLNLTILDLLVGGSETVSHDPVVYCTAANHPDVQERLQKD